MTKRTQIEKIHKTPAAGSFTLGDRVYLKFGGSAVKGIHVLATALVFGLVLLADYLIVLFTAVNVLPNIAALVQKETGISVEMRIDAVIAGWLIPVLFIVRGGSRRRDRRDAPAVALRLRPPGCPGRIAVPSAGRKAVLPAAGDPDPEQGAVVPRTQVRSWLLDHHTPPGPTTQRRNRNGRLQEST